MNDEYQTIQHFKTNNMTDKKQSGYQKLKAEIEELRRDVFKMIAGTDEEKAEVIKKHTVPVPEGPQE